MTPFNPDDWMDVFVLMFLGLCPVAAVAIPAWLGLRKQVGHIRNEVTNNHDENLRDEITRGFREVRADIGGLRADLSIERQERIDGDRLRLVRMQGGR